MKNIIFASLVILGSCFAQVASAAAQLPFNGYVRLNPGTGRMEVVWPKAVSYNGQGSDWTFIPVCDDAVATVTNSAQMPKLKIVLDQEGEACAAIQGQADAI